MYKRILISIDDSDTSREALNEAIKFAKDQQAKIRVIHVVEGMRIDYAGYGMGVDFSEIEEAEKKMAKKILSDAEKQIRDAKIECDSQLIELRVSEGRIEEKIVEAAKTWPADLLVLGTHGRRGFSHFLLGSVAEGIIRIATIPVLLIRKNNHK